MDQISTTNLLLLIIVIELSLACLIYIAKRF